MADHDQSYPQDAPATQPVGQAATEGMPQGPTTSWPTWRPSTTPAPAPAASEPIPPPVPDPRPQWTPPPVPPPAPVVTHVPAPSGPNWGLVLVGLVFVTVAVAVVANQTTGFRFSDVSTFGPGVFVLGGVLCALIGLVGIVSRRRR